MMCLPYHCCNPSSSAGYKSDWVYIIDEASADISFVNGVIFKALE